MAHRLFNALRIARVRPVLSCATTWTEASERVRTHGPSAVIAETWHSAFPGASTVTVCLCESESERTSPATSVYSERLECITHMSNWREYTDKAVQLARERKLEDAENYMRLALSEAIKGFGTDDPHTAEARQNLADRYWKMQKYDLAVPLYIEAVDSLTRIYGSQDARTATALQNLADRYKEMQKYDLALPLYIEVVESLTSIYGPQDAKTAKALHNLAGLYMAQKDVRAASRTMLRAIEATPLNYSANKPKDLWRALAESVRGLAAIYRESSHSVKEVAELLEKDLRSLTKEGEGLAPGILVMIHIEPSTYVSIFKPSPEKQLELIKALSDAEAICRALISNLKNHPDRKDSKDVLSDLCKRLAQIMRAQGRLDEARQLCVEANNYYLVHKGKQAAEYNHDLPALELLIDIELEDGSRDSLHRALDYQQGICRREQASLDEIMDTIETGAPGPVPVVWYKPGTYITGWTKSEMWAKWELERIEKYKRSVAYDILRMIKAQQRLAEVQSRLDGRLDAWATLTQVLALSQSPVLAQAIELEKVEDPSSAKWHREEVGERKQEIQHQMSALYKAICSPLVDGNAEQCVILQEQLIAALAA